MIENLATATPVEIDTRLVAIMLRRAEIEGGIRRAEYTMENAYVDDEAKAKAETDIRNFVIERNTLIEERWTLDDEYQGRGGWTRYFLVTNTNGHVHTSTECTTCFETTDFGWLTQFSDTDHDEMGKLSGMDACAVCFPGLSPKIMAAKRDARIDTPERIPAREQRDAEKAEKAAKAAAKAITNPDGTALRLYDYFGDLKAVKSDVAANRIVMDSAYNIRLYGARDTDGKKWADNVEIGLHALAHKRGTTVEAERATLNKKIEAKYRREN